LSVFLENVSILSMLKCHDAAPDQMDGKDVKRWRESQGLQSKQLAQILGVHPVTVTLSEKRGPSRFVEVLMRQLIANVASGEVSLAEYVGDNPPKIKKRGRPRRRGRPRKYPKGSKRRGKPGRPRKPGRPKGKRNPQKNL
jgi:transcriptional regulator with XRE-family HTH domain